MMKPEERTALLRIARCAALRALGLPVPGPLPDTEALPLPRLSEPGAAFVTWKRDGRLRGCIGTVHPYRTLAEDVEAHALDALQRDPRFPPARAQEFPRYLLEISVLGPLEAVASPPEGIEVGRHGLYVRKGGRAGLLLPQVAVEWGWDVPSFLAQACLKAGLPSDAWSAGTPPAEVHRFEADVFGE
jgi:AmmeMemoRadiSam system protein A